MTPFIAPARTRQRSHTRLAPHEPLVQTDVVTAYASRRKPIVRPEEGQRRGAEPNLADGHQYERGHGKSGHDQLHRYGSRLGKRIRKLSGDGQLDDNRWIGGQYLEFEIACELGVFHGLRDSSEVGG